MVAALVFFGQVRRAQPERWLVAGRRVWTLQLDIEERNDGEVTESAASSSRARQQLRWPRGIEAPGMALKTLAVISSQMAGRQGRGSRPYGVGVAEKDTSGSAHVFLHDQLPPITGER